MQAAAQSAAGEPPTVALGDAAPESGGPAGPGGDESRNVDAVLQELAEVTAPLTGEDFFRSVVRYLARAYGLRTVFVTECMDYPTTRLRTLAYWELGELKPSVEYRLAGTPCNATIESGRMSCLPDNLLEHFPQYAARGRKSYLGVPVLDPVDNLVIGHVAFWDEKPIVPEAVTERPIFRIVLSRIGAELRRKRADDILAVAAGTLAPTTGEPFFQGLVECLAKTLSVRVAFIAECLDDPPTRARTLARWQDDGARPALDFPLAGYPCGTTVGRGIELFVPRALGETYPQEKSTGLESYLGIPVSDPTTGRVLGHLALLDDKPMPASLPANPLLRIFLSRVAAELRRKRADDTMWWLAEASAPYAGTMFFQTLARELARALSFREVFVTECLDEGARRVRMLSHWVNDGFGALHEYDLAGTPCDLTISERRTTFIGDRLEAMFPQCQGKRTYIGLPIYDTQGARVIGHIAFFDDRVRSESVLESPIFRILASRAGVELLRKRAEEELREREAQYRLIVENQSDLIVKLDGEGRYRFVSPSFCRFFARAEPELLGAPFHPEVHPNEQAAFWQAYGAVFAPPHRASVEARVMSAEGWRWMAWAWSAMPEESGERLEVIASGRDVTDRKRAEDVARMHLQALAHMTRVSSMGEMASAIAHEVNQPLTAVVTYTQALARLVASGEADRQELIDVMGRVVAQAARASEIIAHLRTFVRKHETSLAPVSLDTLVGNVVALAVPDARRHDVELVTELADNLPAILADGIQIEQVLVNLVRNAIEAIDTAGARERRVRIRTFVGQDRVVAQVEDSGPGFDDDTLARVFEPFFTTKAQGMGIGLSISQSIVEAHGGRLSATRGPLGGACFTLELPPAVAGHGDQATG